ncbi:hypothetical protein LLG46_15395 [bacterium]|nr:hypothetical protein [bacterium]
MGTRDFVVKKIGLPVAERIKGWPVSSYLSELNKSQWWTPAQLTELQNDKLRRLVKHAYETVEFYREIFDSVSLTPSDIKCAQDLPKVPIINKALLKTNYPAKTISSEYDANELNVMASSGSTGEPFQFLMSDSEKAWKWASIARFWGWGGYELGDKYVNITRTPHRAFRNGWLHRLEEAFSGMLAIDSFELFEGNAEKYARQILDFKPKMLRGHCSALHYLAQVLHDTEQKLQFQSVFTTGEKLYDFQREVMESVYGCRVHDHYGGESMEIACQCDHGKSYHINAENVIVEVVDAQGNPCTPGVRGELVITDLNQYSMPFIRYNIQDVGVLSSSLCSCGRGLPLLDEISGRVTDFAVTPSGKPVLMLVFTGMFLAMPVEVKAFQIVQEKIDLFNINIVPGIDFESVRDKILHQAHDYLGDDVTVNIVIVDKIPLTAGGKRRLFVSKCSSQPEGI